MDQQQPLLSTKALTIGYSRSRQVSRTVAKSLDVSLWPGQLVCLLGPNGAGKSTLMRTLAGLQDPLGGQIFVTGQELAQLSPTALAQKLSLVLAERVDTGNLLVRELVALGRTPHTGWFGNLTASDHEQVQNALEMTETLGFAHRRLHELSDGERQKVMLARALAQDTDLILLDEPTAHLDLPNRVEMMRLLHRLSRQTQKAILLSTHELDLALQTADKLWLLDAKGHLAVGAPEDLVLTGAFEITFAKEGFSFDRNTGTFTMHADEIGPTLHLTGDENLLFWTRRALYREGFIVGPSNEATCTITASNQSGRATWQYTMNGHDSVFFSITDLLASLQELKNNSVLTTKSVLKQ
ncbi:ABC transporter ATP-binding protein [Spirosoma oryzicola]|uniref:ABC transporter ATP-binding protein n=1 Tax=Spirosoma oryzicola TaxID=2898794 RepID=UPI001E529D1D|nr:ABC transporter ATP-binding protein [Spirosoma oryzicola]UHG94283.1 ABC transporter ATP-binding protein [Spirosoma oryzicola]